MAYVPGLVMRRAADLYLGEAKTDKRDAFIIADTGRTRRRQVSWLDAGSDELLGQLRVLNGFDIDLAADQTRLANRLRDALTSVSPALERALGKRLAQAGVRDLLARYPTLTALRNAGRARIAKVVKARSPRLAVKVTGTVMAALDAQSVTVPAEAATGRVIAELATELESRTGFPGGWRTGRGGRRARRSATTPSPGYGGSSACSRTGARGPLSTRSHRNCSSWPRARRRRRRSSHATPRRTG